MAFLSTDPYSPYGTSSPAPQYLQPSGGGAAAPAATQNVPMWMQPWSTTATAQAGTPGYGGGWSDVSAPAAYGGSFNYSAERFNAPTGLTYMNDPGYQARMKMGTDALERSAAARGDLLSGGTAKALSQFGQDYGSNEFQNVFNRSLQGYQANEQNRYNAAALNQGGALQAYGINSGQQMQASMANAQGRQADVQFGFNAGMGAYDREYQAYRDDQAAAFNRPFSLAQLGYNASSNAAGQYANTSANNAAQRGDYWTGAANANAAGQVASGNAWGGAVGNAGNAIGSAYLWNQYGGAPTGGTPQTGAGGPYSVNGGATMPPTGYYGAYQPPQNAAYGFNQPNYGQYW